MKELVIKCSRHKHDGIQWVRIKFVMNGKIVHILEVNGQPAHPDIYQANPPGWFGTGAPSRPDRTIPQARQ